MWPARETQSRGCGKHRLCQKMCGKNQRPQRTQQQQHKRDSNKMNTVKGKREKNNISDSEGEFDENIREVKTSPSVFQVSEREAKQYHPPKMTYFFWQ